MHKTETVDYAILLDGERTLVLDECEIEWKPGDVVIDVGAWHQWSSRNLEGGRVAFDMIAATFVDGPVGLAQGNDKIMHADTNQKLPPGVKPARRIVVTDREPYKSSLVSDGPSPDVRTDPARPGFAIQRMWVTDGTPCKIVLETLHLPFTLEPPANGSVMNVFTFPPDTSGKATSASAKSGPSSTRSAPLVFDVFVRRAASLYAEDTHARFRDRHRGRDRARSGHE